ncbi:MAG: hypothetical protein ACI8W9_000914, partial [Psychromonas sp.]
VKINASFVVFNLNSQLLLNQTFCSHYFFLRNLKPLTYVDWYNTYWHQYQINPAKTKTTSLFLLIIASD